MARLLSVSHDPPYGSERIYSGRWATALAPAENEVRVFLFADALVTAARGQQVPEGHDNAGTLTATLVRNGGQIGLGESLALSRAFLLRRPRSSG